MIAKKWGSLKLQEKTFSLIVLVGVMIGLIILVKVGIAFIKPLVVLLGSQ